MANVTPRACAKAYELHLAGRHGEALELAGKISKAEWAMGKGGILGTKVCQFYQLEWARADGCSTLLFGQMAIPLIPRSAGNHCRLFRRQQKRTSKRILRIS